MSLQEVVSSNEDLPSFTTNLTKSSIITPANPISLSSTTIILRFRDLITSNGETIRVHRQLIEEHGFVWWGWWKKQTENAPKDLLRDLSQRAHTLVPSENAFHIYLYDSGQEQLFKAQLLQIAFQKRERDSLSRTLCDAFVLSWSCFCGVV